MRKNSLCRLCGNVSSYLFDGALLNFSISYYECPECGYVQTETPYWLEEAYSSPINVFDTGILLRNSQNLKFTASVIKTLGLGNGRVLDYSGGYGILVRMLRDIGIDAYWSDKYSENLLSRGFEYRNQKISILTAYEVFEHLVEPMKDIDKLFDLSSNIIISTELIDARSPRSEDWWYYGSEHGQHIGFYKYSTLEFIARKYNKYLFSNGKNLHVLTDKKICKFKFFFISKVSFFSPRLLFLSKPRFVWKDHQKLRRN